MGFRTGKKERICPKGAAGSGKCQEEPGAAGWDQQSPTPHEFIRWGLLFQAVQFHTLVRPLEDGADMLPDGSLKHGKGDGTHWQGRSIRITAPDGRGAGGPEVGVS